MKKFSTALTITHYHFGNRENYYYYLRHAASLYSTIAIRRDDDLTGARNSFPAITIALMVNLFRTQHHTLPIEWNGLLSSCSSVLYLLVLYHFPTPEKTPEFTREVAIQDVYAELVHAWLSSMFLITTPWLFFHSLDMGNKPDCNVEVFILLWCHLPMSTPA